jgi:tRNA-splicing ligase RtcB
VKPRTGKKIRGEKIRGKSAFRPTALGVPRELESIASACVRELEAEGVPGKAIRRLFARLVETPAAFLEHPILGRLAAMLGGQAPSDGRKRDIRPASSFVSRAESAPWRSFGEDLDPGALEQMEHGCSLPIAVAGALMPDAHVGYGLPIGGVLAVENAVIPYGVGMDIACRMKMSVYAVSPDMADTHEDELAEALERETRFGVGAAYRHPQSHPVMDEDWDFSPVTRQMRDKAWSQLGTSGAGNHFVEWGVLDVPGKLGDLEPGRYLALLSHSGSRGTGGEVAKYYSSLARRLRPELPRHLSHLSWLDLNTDEGREYWAAMQLMGRYSAANHVLIHAGVSGYLGLEPVWRVENHHNFAWEEVHDGRRVIVHRKGATPAGAGVLGVIPGTMIHPAFVVEGLGNPLSLNSAAHGAGRAMSRKEATRRFKRKDLEDTLRRAGVRLLSAGVDEIPMAYKDIRTVMAAQHELVRVRATFTPRIVKMAR